MDVWWRKKYTTLWCGKIGLHPDSPVLVLFVTKFDGTIRAAPLYKYLTAEEITDDLKDSGINIPIDISEKIVNMVKTIMY